MAAIALLVVGFHSFVMPQALLVDMKSASGGAVLLWLTEFIMAKRGPVVPVVNVLLPFVEGLLLMNLWCDPGVVARSDAEERGLVENGGDADVHMCPVCKVNVEEFDHHCGLIGACIGKGTYPIFLVFLAVASVELWIGFFFSATVVVHMAMSGKITAIASTANFFDVIEMALPQVVTVFAAYGSLAVTALFLNYLRFAMKNEHSLGRRRHVRHWTEEVRGIGKDAPRSAMSCGNLCGVLSGLKEVRLAHN
jgi:hypothetical protein